MTMAIKKIFNWDGSLTVSKVHYVHDWEHGSVQVNVVLELRVLCLAGNIKLTMSYTEGNLNKQYLKAYSHIDIIFPIRLYPLQQSHTS